MWKNFVRRRHARKASEQGPGSVEERPWLVAPSPAGSVVPVYYSASPPSEVAPSDITSPIPVEYQSSPLNLPPMTTKGPPVRYEMGGRTPAHELPGIASPQGIPKSCVGLALRSN
jgi:hypothetical protein